MRRDDSGLSTREATLALIGGALGLLGTYWDDAWHTDRGRDAFAAPPHLVLYAGVLVGLAVAVRWAFRVARRGRWTDALVLTSRSGVACWGGIAVVLSAPIDELWHRAYGRDAVLWSPPHLLAITGSAALLVGLVLGMPVGSVRARLGSAIALGAFLVPVMEYETDVPQFSASLYLPAAVLGVTLARPVAIAALGGRWPLTQAAGWYTALRSLITAGLALLGHSTPVVPPILLAAVAIDVASRVRPRWVGAIATGVAVPLAYVPLLGVVPGIEPLGNGVPEAAALSLIAALAGALTSEAWRHPALAAGVLLVAALMAAPARPAAAHDPGQGDVVGQVTFAVTADGRRLDVTADLPDDVCRRGAITLVARRGGQIVRRAAETRSPCIATAALHLDQMGRWFVYVEQGRVEGWLPVEVGGRRTVRETRDLYQRPSPPSGATQPLSGVVLVAISILLVVMTARAATVAASHKAVPTPE